MSLTVDIQKHYKDFHLAVKFQIDGNRLGILGNSGCGKSLTLKCIAGIETPDAGRIVLGGRTLFDKAGNINLTPQQRGVGYLFQQYALFPHLTVAQNIGVTLPKGYGPLEKRDTLVSAYLTQFELEGYQHHYPHQLSGGQQQRVALARMLASKPEIILLDEPFSALDTHLREQMQLELLALLAPFPDVLLVTHSRDEVFRMCDRLMVMSGGTSLVEGDTKSLFLQPTSVTVAKLTGCKNISPIKRTGVSAVYATDWGIHLETAQPVGENITHVGIRAHDLVPAGDAGQNNLMPFRIQSRTEDLFEWNLLVCHRETGQGVLWWKCGKQITFTDAETLRLPPEALLLLTD